MARESTPSPSRPGQKRQRDTAISWMGLPPPESASLRFLGPPTQNADFQKPESGDSSSNYDLYDNSNYELYREDVPYRMYKYQRIPPLINHVPVKIRRTHMGMGVKSSFSPHKAPSKSHLPPRQIKIQAEDLNSIRGELSQIKAQVDRLLESLEHMDQQRDQLPGTEDSEENRGPGIKGSSCRTTEPQQEPRDHRAHPEAGSSEDSTDLEEAVKNHAWDQEGSQ